MGMNNKISEVIKENKVAAKTADDGYKINIINYKYYYFCGKKINK